MVSEGRAFYEARYESGYMEDWPDDKKEKIRIILNSLELPATGKVLDFGCGSGVFSRLLSDFLPGWSIDGYDFSETAVGLARHRGGRVSYVSSLDCLEAGSYDLVFSHHVLEHVSDLEGALSSMKTLLKCSSGMMLHFLPCGNKGSFEHKLSSRVAGGIDDSKGGRFFYEDPGHLRRLTTRQLEANLSELGFELIAERYMNHFYGALEWMLVSGPIFLLKTFNPFAGKGLSGKIWLVMWGLLISAISVLIWPLYFSRKLRRQAHKRTLYKLAYYILLPFSILSIPVEKIVNALAWREFQSSLCVQSSSSMALLFRG